MSEEQRVQCPKCGLRFKVPPERVPEGTSLTARCRQCNEAFDVRNLHGRVVVDVTPAAVAPKPVAKPLAKAPAKPRTSLRPSDVQAERLPGGFQVGDRLGRYEIEGLAGRGGMGTVYRAYDPSANRHVALKVLRRDATDLDRLRFEREIAVQANIRHTGIMPIFDSGTVGSTRFYAMELLHDPVDLLTLTERVQFRKADDKRLRTVSTLLGVLEHVVMPICLSVQHANEEGVLHRDIKPINVMVDRRNLRPYLIDFGVSSLLEPHNPRMAHIDESFPVPLRGKGVHVTGTLMFMPPEQALGDADRRGDVWGLGALLHFLVTGSAPFEEAIRPVIPRAERVENIRLLIDEARAAGNDDEVHEYEAMLGAIERGSERTVEQLRRDVLRGRYLPRPPGLDARLDGIIAKAMHRMPDKRYDHAGLLHDALKDWLAGQKKGAPHGASDGERTPTGPLWKHPAVAALAGMLLVGGGAALWPRDKGPDPSAVAAGHLARADQYIAKGDLDAERDAVRAALTAFPSDAVLARWDRIAARAQVPAALARIKDLLQRAKDPRLSQRARDRLLGAVMDRIEWLEAMPDDAEHFISPQGLSQFSQPLGQSVRFESVPEGTATTLVPWTNDRGALWKEDKDLKAFPPEPGRYVVWFRRAGRDVLLPIEVAESDKTQTFSCPVDPARVPVGLVYVGGGSFTGPDGRSHAVPPLLWEKHEVTMDRYAQFLESLAPEQRRERVPRLAGDLGERGKPVWKASGDRFLTPSGGLRLPVENLSPYDAKAFAAFAKRRLPTAAEWTWAAAGPFAPATPVGDFATLRGRAHLGDPSEGVKGVMEAPGDRNVFGLFDMTGNLAEFTSTLARTEESGWIVKGGSYAASPEGALVHAERAAPGWMPQAGVGMRLVTDVSALEPAQEPPPAKDDTQK